ncbi:hypothetical protein GYMLUDRAFT_45891 [Collybiopsis luxurians FD-317 M1]|uniref:Uncharacterized protein n=1 Tax=Collybiopsis luxurians FD-317 M1 TaxID=944289 RepID=A0A0D0B383_9AGAR|nr:hypothetical protein GYMLUDRAFT_45891 [Collybiopsis luxurians FD-317 M1]
MIRGAVLVFSLVAGLHSVFAQSTASLYIPGFDSQSIDAQIVGVDSSGHTTWALSPGSVTDAAEQGFEGTLTLVEGSDTLHLSYGDAAASFTMDIDCALASNQAVCTASADGTIVTATDTITPIAVAVVSGTAAPATVTGSSSNSGSSTISSSQASSGSGTASSETASQTGSTQNSANQLATPFVSLLGVIGLMLFWL